MLLVSSQPGRCVNAMFFLLMILLLQLEALEIVGHLDSGRMAIQAWAPAVLFLCFIYTFGNYCLHHLFCLLLTKQCSLQNSVLLLRLPREHMKHGYFKIDVVRIPDKCWLFIWPAKYRISLRYTTLRIHFNKFEKVRYTTVAC